MKRLLILFGTLMILSPLAGCGSSTGAPAPVDRSNLPSEVREYEDKREQDRAKGTLPKAPPAPKPAAS